MGGRNQNTHSLRSLCRPSLSVGRGATVTAVAVAEVGDFSAGSTAVVVVEVVVVVVVVVVVAELPSAKEVADFMAKSNGLPGDLGVFADPKPENAPDPKPKAVCGLITVPGVVALKGLDLACEELSPPSRLEKETLRSDESVVAEPAPEFGVERESFPEL